MAITGMGERIVAVVGARLNSSRLPRKHLLPLAGRPMISHVVERLQHIPAIDQIVVATTADDYNRDLVHWAADVGVSCYAHEGDVNDLMGRVDVVVRREKADILLYICGDCPLIEPTTIAGLIDQLRQDSTAEVANLAPPETGHTIHEGFSLYRRSLWDRMMAAATEPFEREHVGAVLRYSGKVSPTGVVYYQDAPIYSCIKHRISLDTGQDYRFIKRIYDDWYHDHDASKPVSLAWVIERLLAEPDLRAINAEVHQRTVEETPAVIALLAEAGPSVGLGHLVRTCVAASALQAHMGAKVKLFVRGVPTHFEDLILLPHEWVTDFTAVEAEIRSSDAVILDVKNMDDQLVSQIDNLPPSVLKVLIDKAPDRPDFADLIWIPSIYVPQSVQDRLAPRLVFGPDCFLLRPTPESARKPYKGASLVVLTGGSDPAGLGRTLPEMLAEHLPKNVHIDWVQGPYAPVPNMPNKEPGQDWQILHAPDNLNELLGGYTAALCVYGVTFYECLQAGVPVVTFDAIGAASPDEWRAVADLCQGRTADNASMAASQVAALIAEDGATTGLEIQARLKSGPRNFATRVAALLDERNVHGATA